LSARLVNRQFALKDHLLAVLQQLALGHCLAAKDDAIQLRVRILEREVDMPELCARQLKSRR